MRGSAGVALIVALSGCRITLDEAIDAGNATVDAPTPAACLAANGRSDFAFVRDKILVKQCTYSGCHNGSADEAGQLDLRMENAYASLMNRLSLIDENHLLVVPGMPTQSYLLLMLKHIQPADMEPDAIPPDETDPGYMPKASVFKPLCIEKLNAIERWIAAGALND
ncbi:MAG: hypothetical protein AB7O24_06485 [Kofleriaceae bacterium]